MTMKLLKLKYVLAALLVASPVFAWALTPLSSEVLAAGQITVRSIQMSSSHVSDSSVSYLVTFTPATTAAQSLVINFCQESPIPSATCTTPSGFSVASAGFTAGTGFTNWATGTLAAGQYELTKNTGSNLATSAVSFTITGVTNPSSTGAFYARLYTYSNTSYNGYTNSTSIGTPMDTGGFALSIVSYINVQATIQETLTFCVSKASPGSGCSGTTAPNLTIGNGGTPNVLDTAGVYTDTAYTQITSNATTGVSVSMKTPYTCTGLSKDSGTTCPIAGMGAFASMTAGTAKFGLLVANGTGGTGTVTANGNYGTTAGSYGMGTNVTSTYGDPIESSSAPTIDVNSLLTFAATSGASVTAGVYQTNEMLIATGTF